MEINTRELRGSKKYVGQKVWICDYNRPDLDKKPLRNVPPTLVKVFSNDDLPSNKRVYYSEVHFRPLNKEGAPTSKILSPVDNTGFRARSGNELYVFDNEQECKEKWNELLDKHISSIEYRIKTAQQFWEREKQQLLDIKK